MLASLFLSACLSPCLSLLMCITVVSVYFPVSPFCLLYLLLCLSFSLSACTSVSVPFFQFILLYWHDIHIAKALYIVLSLTLPVFLCTSLTVPVCLFLPACLSIFLHICFCPSLSLTLPVSLCTSLALCVYLFLPVSLSACPSLPLPAYLCLCLSVYFTLFCLSL